MSPILHLLAFLSAFLLACSSSETASAGGVGGFNGASAAAATSSSSHAAAAASSSTGGLDAGGDAGCPRCEACLSSDPTTALASIQSLCAASDAAIFWAQLLACACIHGQPCWQDCHGDMTWCAGVYPTATNYTPPSPPCEACLEAKGATGCGDQRYGCLAH